jgi:hypothetical protein
VASPKLQTSTSAGVLYSAVARVKPESGLLAPLSVDVLKPIETAFVRTADRLIGQIARDVTVAPLPR